jgi:hypothetical protein
MFHQQTNNNNNNNNEMTPLPYEFTPGPYDVICARGKIAKTHSGNKYYRSLVQGSMTKYSQATNKYEKSQIVSDIVDEVKAKSPEGGFIKKEDEIWYSIGEHLAREKCGQNLRDGLSQHYKSSTKAKRRRRELMSADLANEIENMIQLNPYVSRCITNLQVQVQKNESAPEIFVSELFSKTNLDILEAFKQDKSLLNQFNEAEKLHRSS